MWLESTTIVWVPSTPSSERTRLIDAAGPGTLLLVSYPLLQIDGQAFAGREWATLVLDEAQAIKNAAAKQTHAVKALQARHRLLLEEHARVLGDRVEQPAEARPRSPEAGVGVAHGVHLGSCRVDGHVQPETDRVDRTLAVRELALVVDLDEIGHAHLPERHAERVDPQAIGVLGIAHGDVSEQPLAEALRAEDPAGRRQSFEPVP